MIATKASVCRYFVTHYPRIPREYWEHHIVIDLGEDKVISGFSYLPRPESENRP